MTTSNTPTLPLKTHHTAGCVLLDALFSDANMLLIYRAWNVAPEGAYILPKGHVEHGESTGEAALRETIEETGYGGIKLVEELATDTIEYENKGYLNRKHLTWYLATLQNLERVPTELTETEAESTEFKLVWKPVGEALELLAASPLDAEKSVVGALRGYLETVK